MRAWIVCLTAFALTVPLPSVSATSPQSALSVSLSMEGDVSPGAERTLVAHVVANMDLPHDTRVNLTAGGGIAAVGSTSATAHVTKGTPQDVRFTIRLPSHGVGVVEVWTLTDLDDRGNTGGGYRRAFLDVDHGTFSLDSDFVPAHGSTRSSPGLPLAGLVAILGLLGSFNLSQSRRASHARPKMSLSPLAAAQEKR